MHGLCTMKRLHWASPDVIEAWLPVCSSLSWRQSQNNLAKQRWKKAFRVASSTNLLEEAKTNYLLCLLISDTVQQHPLWNATGHKITKETKINQILKSSHFLCNVSTRESSTEHMSFALSFNNLNKLKLKQVNRKEIK